MVKHFQGFVSKKLDVLPAFREHFFVLQPHLLTLYASASEKEKRAEIPINGQCRVESIPDSKSKSPLKKVPGGKQHSRFSLFADEKTYDFQACDHRYNSLDKIGGLVGPSETESAQ